MCERGELVLLQYHMLPISLYLVQASRCQHPGNLEQLFGPVINQIRAYGGPFALHQCYKQMDLSIFYVAWLLLLPAGYDSWVSCPLLLENTCTESLISVESVCFGC